MMRARWCWILVLASACSNEPSGPPAWRAVFEKQPGALLRVWGTSSEDVYIVGADAEGTGPTVLHYDGDEWEILEPPVSGSLWWVDGVAPDDVRMVGDGGVVVRYTPSTGKFEVRPTPTDLRLFGVWGSSSSDVWYVGGNPGLNRGVILRDDGSTVSEISVSGTSSTAFFKVLGFAPDQVWIAGQRGAAIYYDGAEFRATDTGTFLPLMGIHGTRADHIWAVGGVGDGVIMEWDGSTWTEQTPAGTPQMIGVWAASDEDVLASGCNGRIYRKSAGTWNEVTDRIPTFEDLHAIWVDGESNIWTVGGLLAEDPPSGGVLVRYGAPIADELPVP
jgi:hypothetical protein